MGGHPRSVGQVSGAPGAAGPIGTEGGCRGWARRMEPLPTGIAVERSCSSGAVRASGREERSVPGDRLAGTAGRARMSGSLGPGRS